jgi:hypothetical protein
MDKDGGIVDCFALTSLAKKNSMAWLREQTIPPERPPFVGEVSANFAKGLKILLRIWRTKRRHMCLFSLTSIGQYACTTPRKLFYSTIPVETGITSRYPMWLNVSSPCPRCWTCLSVFELTFPMSVNITSINFWKPEPIFMNSKLPQIMRNI